MGEVLLTKNEVEASCTCSLGRKETRNKQPRTSLPFASSQPRYFSPSTSRMTLNLTVTVENTTPFLKTPLGPIFGPNHSYSLCTTHSKVVFFITLSLFRRIFRFLFIYCTFLIPFLFIRKSFLSRRIHVGTSFSYLNQLFIYLFM